MNILSLNAEKIIEKNSLEVKLRSGKKLRVKFGADPTKPDLHLGHAVALRVLKKFQQEGHTIIFLLGDFTAGIGDPSGRDKTREPLTEEQIKENARTYLDQVGKILDLKLCEVRRNSEWYGKMDLPKILEVLSKATLAQVIEREDFKKRLEAGVDIGLHEVIYPVMQGYDSVELKADVEVGGQDQLLNMLMGRDIQKKYGHPPQDVITVPLLIGTDGKQKMSKSYGNYIGLTDKPEDQFGKVMSIPDKLIESYLDLVTNFDDARIKKLKSELKGGNPKDVKEQIAENVVEIYHGKDEAKKAREHFNRVFRQKKMPEEMDEITVHPNKIPSILVETGLASSNSQAYRLIEQNGVKLDGRAVDEDNLIVKAGSHILQVGKFKFVKIKFDD
jgi:tyrosyl-tRNA synthetase